MINENSLKLSGLSPIRGEAPGFATPLFCSDQSSEEFIQDIDSNGVVCGFLPSDIGSTHARSRNVPRLPISLGDEAIYGLLGIGNSSFVGSKSDFREERKSLFDMLCEFPFISSQLSRFMGDTDNVESAKSLVQRLIDERSIENRKKSTELCNSVLETSPIGFQSVECFRINFLPTIDIAMKFIDEITPNDPNELFTWMSNWARESVSILDKPSWETIAVEGNAILLGFWSSMINETVLAHPYGSTTHPNITMASDFDKAKSATEMSVELTKSKMCTSGITSIPCQLVLSKIEGNFLDLRNSKRLAASISLRDSFKIGLEAKKLGADGVIYPDDLTNDSNSFSISLYNFDSITSVLDAGVSSLKMSLEGALEWTAVKQYA